MIINLIFFILFILSCTGNTENKSVIQTSNTQGKEEKKPGKTTNRKTEQQEQTRDSEDVVKPDQVENIDVEDTTDPIYEKLVDTNKVSEEEDAEPSVEGPNNISKLSLKEHLINLREEDVVITQEVAISVFKKLYDNNFFISDDKKEDKERLTKVEVLELIDLILLDKTAFSKDLFDRSLLSLCINTKSTEIFVHVLNRYIDTNRIQEIYSQDMFGRTILHVIAQQNNIEAYNALKQILKDNNIDINALNQPDKNEKAPVAYMSIKYGEIYKELTNPKSEQQNDQVANDEENPDQLHHALSAVDEGDEQDLEVNE